MKGLSQVITSALILAVGVAVAGVYANWAPDFAEGIAGETADQQNQRLKCRNAGLRISSAEYDRTGNFTDIELKNTGTINLRKSLTIAILNNSRIINTTQVNQIEVDETRTRRIPGQEIPDEVVITSEDCPDIRAFTDSVNVRK